MIDISIPTNTLVTKVEDPPDRPRRELLTPIPGSPGEYLLVMDNSAIETFTTCPRYAFYHEVMAREAHARNASLTFGGACHVGWEHIERDEGKKLFIQSDKNPSDPDYYWCDVDTAQRVLSYFTQNPTPPDEYRTPAIALELLAHYRVRKTLPDYQWEVLHDKAGLLVERAFEIPLGVLEVGTPIKLPNWEIHQVVDKIHVAWSGRIDLIARCNGKNRVVDNKTTSIAGDQFVQDFQLSNATIGYVWAAQQLWPDLNIDGFCLNAAHLKKPVAGCGLMDKGPRGGAAALNFFRAYYDYSPSRLAQWEDNAMTLVEDFVNSLVRDRFPLHTKWCFGKYGKCQFHDVCTMDEPDVRQRMLLSDMFKDVTWNPTSER